MIITVTMNPAIDKTVEVKHLLTGGLNRIQHVETDIGGKGINVSKTIKALGGNSIATGLIGQKNQPMIEEALQIAEIRTDFVSIMGETRTNLKVLESDGAVTELNESGPSPTPRQLELLIQKLMSYASKQTLFVLAGSIPAGVPVTIYQDMIQQLHQKDATVLMDADGELFRCGLLGKPDILKPNREELERFFELDHPASEQELLLFGRKLLAQGSSLAAISLGAAGALFITPQQAFKCQGLKVNAHSTVGAGDAMVAALAYGWDQQLSLKEQVILAMAVSAGAVTTIGTKPPSRAVVEALQKQVLIEEIN